MASILEGSNLGRYRIVEQIGRGGMAAVFKAYDPALDRFVAIKVLAFLHSDAPGFLERFRQEAQSIARLNHPNILQVYDIGEDRGFTYIVMEYLPGGTLLDRAKKPFTLEQAVDILRPLAEALDYAHSRGIIHRDIKPSNVLMKSEDEPVLADFGLSRAMEQVYHMTAPQEVIGTPEYMSPEQALGRDIDHRADLYALGILAYQLLVGEVPFHANTPAATMMAHVHQPLPLPDSSAVEIDPGVKAVLLRATAKNPDERYPSAKEMVNALAEYLPEPAVSLAEITPQSTMVLPIVSDASAPPVEADRVTTRTRLVRTALTAAGLMGAVAVIVVAVAMLSDNATVATQEPPESLPTPPQAATTPASGGIVDGPEPTPVTPLALALASFDDTIARVQRRVSSLRGLAPVQTIETNLETTDKLNDLADAHFKRRFLREEVFEAEELYKALELLAPGDDLEQITRDIFMQQVSALFDDASGRLYVLSDAPTVGPSEELGYSSVYMAGLQEQLFVISDLRRKARESGNSDQYRALTAFVSGDVSQIQQGYAQTFFSQKQMEELLKPLPGNLLASAPGVVKKTILFPQREGSSFVALVYESRGSWQAVNAVYSGPPVSTEQIIHPEKYLAGEEPSLPELPDMASVMGRGWYSLGENTMGEFMLRTYLEQHLTPEEATRAAAGWNGDRYALLSGPEAERLFVLSLNWDTPADGEEFFQAYQLFTYAKYGDLAINRGDAMTQMWWIAPEQTAFLRSDGDHALLVIADNEALVQDALVALGGF